MDEAGHGIVLLDMALTAGADSTRLRMPSAGPPGGQRGWEPGVNRG